MMRWKRRGRPTMLNDESRKDARAMAERMIQLHSDQTGWNLPLEKKW
jgi:hypothetical protein